MTSQKNIDIRVKAGNNGIPLWAVAKQIGITDSSFSRKLREELSVEEKEKIFSAIDQIIAERNE